MRFAQTADHREYFSKNNYIEFEEVLPVGQVSTLKKNAIETMEKRLHLPFSKFVSRPPQEVLLAGHDLWRSSDAIKKIAHKNAFATIASELFQIVPLRMGFDQLFLIEKNNASPFSQTYSLQDTSCLSPLAGALILPLDDLPTPLSFFPMPIKAGSGLFISPSFPIPWPELFSTPGLNFFMIGFAQGRTYFRPDTRDPHAVTLKKLGYVFNDPLKDSVHPIILRKP